MQTQNTHGWSTLQEGSAHYLYRPVSSMGFTNIEAMIQQLQDCQNKQIAVPEIVRIANGDIFLKEPRGIRSLEDFFKTQPTTRAKLFVAQQLVKLVENLHTFVGISHGGLSLQCLSIDADNKLVLGGISPTSQTPSEDLTALQTLLASIFNQPNEADTLKKIQTSSLKKMRRRIKMMLAEDAWHDVQADWSTAIDQTNIEESSEELPLESPSKDADSALSAVVELDSMGGLDDAIGDELPEPVSFISKSEPATQETTLNDPDSKDFDWELEDDWEDVDIDGWLAEDPGSLDSDNSNLQTVDARTNMGGDADVDVEVEVEANQNPLDIDAESDAMGESPTQEPPQEDTSATLTPEMFGEGSLDDWFNEPEDTMPLTQSDMLRATPDRSETLNETEEISDFEDDDEVLLFSLEPKSKSDLDDVTEFDEETEVFSMSSASNMNPPSNENVDNDLENNNETLDFLLENHGKEDSLVEEAQYQDIDELDEFTLEEPSQEIPALDDDGDFATDIFSRSSLLGTLDIPAEEVQSALDEADMSESWFVNAPNSASADRSNEQKQPSPSSVDNGIPKWVWAASAAVVAGGAWAALHQNDTVEPAVLIDEAQTKNANDIPVETEDSVDKIDPDTTNTESIQTAVATTSNDDELSVKTDQNIASTTVVEPSTPAVSKKNTVRKTVSKKTAPPRVKAKTLKQRQASKPSTQPKATTVKTKTVETKPAKKPVAPTVASPFATQKETVQDASLQEITVQTLPTPKKKRPLPVEAPLKAKTSTTPTVDQMSTENTEKNKAPAQKVSPVATEPVVEVAEQVPTTATTATKPLGAQAMTEQQQDADPVEVEDTPPTTADSGTEEPTSAEPVSEVPPSEMETETSQADATNESTGSTVAQPEPIEDTPRPISATDYRNWSSNAVQGKLNDYSIERLQSVEADDASFTRANAILLTHAQQSGDAELIGNSLEQLLSVETNAHKPIYLLAMAQHQFNVQNLDGAREYLMQAELNWANVERSQLMVLRAQRDNIVAHLSYVSFLESGSEDSRLQSLTQFRKVQREARRAKLRSLFEQAESKMQQLQRGNV